MTVSRALRDLLDEWDERAASPEAEGLTAGALRLLAAAESAEAGMPAPLWHRFLDTTRRPRFLQSLPGRADRHRWADAAVEAIRASRYSLATMLAQRVREHPGRTLFQELSKLGGPPGWVLAAAIASSTTVAMGRAAAVWFERGEKAKASDLRAESRSLAKRMLQSLKKLGRRRPPREAVEREVEAALSEAPD